MNIRNILTIFKREVGATFNSAIAYIYLIVFVLINNSLFLTRFFLLDRSDMRSFFENMPFVLLVFIPVISMRLWAEDRKSNTFELLMTFPMKPAELVLGKFLASLVFYAVALASSCAIPVMLFLAGSPDIGPIVGGYLGSFLMGALFLSIGIFVSGLTREQIVAFVVTVLSCFLVFFLGTDFFASAIDGWVPGMGTFIMRTLGAGAHLVGFIRGVIDIKDILYFVIASGIFLFLNALFFEGRMRPKSRVIFGTAIGVCLASMVVFNWIIKDIPWGRFDITEGQVYTVTASSRKILNQLKSTVQVRVYLTPPEKMPTAMKTLEGDVAGKLEELKLVSNGHFEYKIIHTEASRLMEQKKKDAPVASGETPLESLLQEKGIVPFQVESIDRDELGVKLVYAAITIDYVDKSQEVLPRILPATVPDLEYLLLSRVVKMTFAQKPRIALYAPLKSAEITPEMSQILASLGKTAPQYQDSFKTLTPLISNNGYDFRRIGLTQTDGIPSDLSALLVLAPGALNDRQRYEINRYLYEGGTVVVAAQGYEYAFQLRPPNGFDLEPQKQPLDINDLIGSWGVKINADMLMDETSDIVNVSVGQQAGPLAMTMPVKLPNQLIVRPETMNRKTALMSRQPAFIYLWGSALDVAEDVIKTQGLKYTVLFTSSPRSWKVAHEEGMLKPEATRFPKTGSAGRFPLGVVMEGQFADAFAGKDVPAWPAKEGDVAVTPAAKEKEQKADEKDASLVAKPATPGKLIVLGCSKIFTDELVTNGPILSLFANIIDGLALGDDVVQIRAKTQTNRGLKKLSDAQKLGLRFMTIVLVPVLWIVFATLRLFLRRKEKQFYLVARSS